MALKFLALAALAVAATTVGYLLAAAPAAENRRYFAEFQAHQRAHGKLHASPAEAEYRYAVFADNMAYVEAHNATDSPFTMGVNQFSDLTFEEFSQKYLSQQILENEVSDIDDGQDDEEVDWLAGGKVTPVKNQARCGSCWAFSATGALESAYLIKNQEEHAKIDLSEQELVDCSGEYGNHGCGGGLMHFAYDYIKDHKLACGKSYKYIARNSSCKRSEHERKFHLSSYKPLDKINVTELSKEVKKQPVAVAIEVQRDFQQYKDGVYVNKACGRRLNHGVLITGISNATASNDEKIRAYHVKNSWGTVWGNKGYINVAVGTGTGTCGIANKWDMIPSL